jgi:hypothetical protein
VGTHRLLNQRVFNVVLAVVEDGEVNVHRRKALEVTLRSKIKATGVIPYKNSGSPLEIVEIRELRELEDADSDLRHGVLRDGGAPLDLPAELDVENRRLK